MFAIVSVAVWVWLTATAVAHVLDRRLATLVLTAAPVVLAAAWLGFGPGWGAATAAGYALWFAVWVRRAAWAPEKTPDTASGPSAQPAGARPAVASPPPPGITATGLAVGGRLL